MTKEKEIFPIEVCKTGDLVTIEFIDGPHESRVDVLSAGLIPGITVRIADVFQGSGAMRLLNGNSIIVLGCTLTHQVLVSYVGETVSDTDLSSRMNYGEGV